MTKLDQKITPFVLAISAAMLVTGGLAVMLLSGLASLVPSPESSLARHLHNGAAIAVAIVIGLRVSGRLERSSGGE